MAMGVSSTSVDGAPMRTVAVSPAMVQQRAAALVSSNDEARVLLLRAQPSWDHGDVKVGERVVRVFPAVSQLAILDIFATLGADEYAVVLTDRPTSDLGQAVLTRVHRQHVEMPDEWEAVPQLFTGAREVDRELRRLSWAATALLDHKPVDGWPRSPELAVTASHAIGALTAEVLGLGASHQLDEAGVLFALGRREVRTAWVAVDETLRRHLIDWSGDELGPAAAFALRVAQRQEHVTPLAVGLALDVLWPEDGASPEELQVAARARVERYIDGKTISVQEAKTVAQAAKATVLRSGLEATPEIAIALKQAEALLDDLNWPAGAERSTVLAPGYAARLRTLSSALVRGEGVEEAFARLQDHRDAAGAEAPAMAVRLHRWLATIEANTSSLAEDLARQVDDGAWVDAALGVIWNGSDDPEVSGAYRELVEKVRARRRARDEIAASRLPEAVTNGGAATLGLSAIGVERILSDVVQPWRAVGDGVLLLVLDGLSAAVATGIAGEIARLGLVEHVPEATSRRLGAVAVLPSLTQISRTSLLSGKVCQGDGGVEKRGLAEAFPKSVLFHKDDLRSSGGASLARHVADAVNDQSVPVVGVVINAIDDAVHKNDTSGWEWRLDQLAPMRALLEAALAARRTVIVTSDHGHVVERETEARSLRGADARWYSAANPVGEGEVLVNGPRVVAEDGQAVLLWREDVHFGPRRAGYHGGASLAEITVPVMVFRRASAEKSPAGWVPAKPQTPEWWFEPALATTPKPAPPRPKKRAKPKTPADQDALFAVEPAPAASPAGAGDLIDALLASAAYADQLSRARRLARDAGKVEAFLRALYARDGRAHRDAVASAAGIATTDIGQVFAAVRRLVNIDGYPVVELDSDGVTYRLDVEMLRDQFELEAGR